MMVSQKHPVVISDPIELLDVTLDCAWHSVCVAFDISSKLPDIRTLFECVDISSPELAAELILSNMLLEITQMVGRFSSWYRMPARAYGLISMRDNTTNCVRWMLAPEAAQRWQPLLKDLAVAIEQNSGLLQAMILVDDLMLKTGSEENYVIASCNCMPPRSIQIRQGVLEKGEIICSDCHQPFSLAEDAL